MTIEKKNVVTDPSLKDLLDLYKRDVQLAINCHALGTVQSFDSDAQTVTATINYKKTKFVWDSNTKAYKAELLDYPLITEMPVVILGGGTSHLTFPISAGDECLILFNDRDMSNWYSGSNDGSLSTPRLHSFTDGIALVGVRSLSNKLSDYDSTRARLYNGDTSIGVSSSKVKIENANYSLGVILQDLLTTLIALTVNTGTGVPNPTWSTDLNTIKTKLAALLE